MIDIEADCPKCDGSNKDCDLCEGGGEVQISILFDFVTDQMKGQTVDEWLASPAVAGTDPA